MSVPISILSFFVVVFSVLGLSLVVFSVLGLSLVALRHVGSCFPCESELCLTLCNIMDSSVLARLLCPQWFSRQESWSGIHALLQGIFPTQGTNSGLPHCRWILYYLSHQGSPLFPRSGIKPTFPALQGGFLNHWTTRKVPILSYVIQNTVDVICITNIRHQNWKDNVKIN